MAFHDYLASIQTEPSSAAIAIAEITNLSVSIADKDGGDERFADQSAQLNECYQTLLRLQQADAGEKNLSEDARVRLFSELKRAHDVCAGIARSQIDAADSLRNDAKGKHWWNRNDRDKEAQALHEVNLAWSYYPSFVDESTVNRMYDIWADMKGELPEWQYKQIMERDRLQLGRVIGDR